MIKRIEVIDIYLIFKDLLLFTPKSRINKSIDVFLNFLLSIQKLFSQDYKKILQIKKCLKC
jgi:hypothetical protein